MTLTQAIQTGMPFRRMGWDKWYHYPGVIELSNIDICAYDWEIKGGLSLTEALLTKKFFKRPEWDSWYNDLGYRRCPYYSPESICAIIDNDYGKLRCLSIEDLRKADYVIKPEEDVTLVYNRKEENSLKNKFLRVIFHI